MKKITFLAAFMLIISSCVTIKKAPAIDDYRVMKGKEFQKKNFTSQTAFIFQNDLKMIDFRSFLAEKYDLHSFKSTMRIPVVFEDISFELFVFTPEKKEQKINFINAIISKNADDISVDESTYDYVAISVSRIDDADCLSETSIYHKLVLRYLEDLKDTYFEL
ncbi:hypothetical protein [Ascidiimonas sp. W6]|uniref:hypothetical protein n=1 Tax=Ascidiimonas meishanensis TaxID=3128903 RepID=UPI0030EDBD37